MARIRIEYNTNNMQKSFKAYKNGKRLILNEINLHWLTSSNNDAGRASSDMVLVSKHGYHRWVDRE